ncbi:hypothetical protein [Eubacterium pyruvativorans]|jgi:hypothetical protein|uniref:hypothetical protein n=1 Tax=Clostridia TaxID=186801 RepID=UPI00240A929D|nr:hypothetical protein [Eubacterium pyruvativorans]MDD6706997.1 hypothetical protein [Eubacterium pyruvativorans]
MYEVKEDILTVTSEKTDRTHLIPLYSREVMDGDSFYKVFAGTSGTIDGEDDDTRTMIEIFNPVGYGLFRIHKDEDGEGYGVSITAIGDDDLRCLIKALKFATKVLEEEALEIND